MTFYAQTLHALQTLSASMGARALLPVGFASLLAKVKTLGISQATVVLVLGVVELVAVALATPSLRRFGRSGPASRSVGPAAYRHLQVPLDGRVSNVGAVQLTNGGGPRATLKMTSYTEEPMLVSGHSEGYPDGGSTAS
jgi:hypothetical protein